MSNIRFVGFLDLVRFAASYEASWRAEGVEIAEGARSLALDALVLAQWGLGAALATRVEGLLKAKLEQPRILDLDPGCALGWFRDGGSGILLCVHRSPTLQLIIGAEVVSPQPGDLLLLNQDPPTSICNYGPYNAVVLHANTINGDA